MRVLEVSDRDFRPIKVLLREAGLSPNLSLCRYVLKAPAGGKVGGAIGVEFWGEYVSLRVLVVKKRLRRKGIGRALVAEAVRRAERDRARGIYAYTLFWNIRFFESCGFVRVPKESSPAEVAESAAYHHPHYRYCCLMKYEGGRE